MHELVQRAIAIIEAEREVLFSGHQVNGVVTVDEAVDQEAVDAINDMDAWLTEARAALQEPQEAALREMERMQSEFDEQIEATGASIAQGARRSSHRFKLDASLSPQPVATPAPSQDAAVVERTPLRDSIAAVMLQTGTPDQQIEALTYAHGKLPATHPADRDGVEARTLDEWHEDDGDVCWWALDESGQWLGEPAYIGSPLDLGRAYSLSIGEHEFVATLGGWPGYHTHWTPHPALPTPPASALAKQEAKE